MDPPGSAPGPAVSKTAMRLSTLRTHKRREDATPPRCRPGQDGIWNPIRTLVRDALAFASEIKRTNTIAMLSQVAAGFYNGRFGVSQAHLPGKPLICDSM